MYCVQCCKYGDIDLEIPFDSLEDACAHALKLRHFYPGVDIVDAVTGEPVELM